MYRLETNELSGKAITRVTIPAKADHPRMLSAGERCAKKGHLLYSSLLVQEDGGNNNLEGCAVDVVSGGSRVTDSAKVSNVSTSCVASAYRVVSPE